jgi:hypothetical protein
VAEFNFGIDCPSDDVAEKLRTEIEKQQIFQDGLDADDERVSVISQQGMLKVIAGFATKLSISLDVEVWPSGTEYDDAEDRGDLETHSFGD